MEFKDRSVQHPGRIKLTRVAGDVYDLERAEGLVEEEGTPINAATLNQMTSQMDGIEGRVSALEMAMPDEEDTSIDAATLNQMVSQINEIKNRVSVLEMKIPDEENFVDLGYAWGYVGIGNATGDWVGYNTETKQLIEGSATNSGNEIEPLFKGHSFVTSQTENYGRSVITYIKAKTGKLRLVSNYPPAGFTEKQVSWLRIDYVPSHEAASIKYID